MDESGLPTALGDLVACADDPDRRRLAAAGTTGLDPLVLRCGDDACTVRPGPVEASVDAGADPDAGCVVRFGDPAHVTAFLRELTSAPGAHVLGQVTYERGGYGEFDQWEPAVRALLHGRPVFDPTAVDRSRLGRVFTADDSDELVAAHVAEYGFAVVRGVYSPGEVDAFNRAITSGRCST